MAKVKVSPRERDILELLGKKNSNEAKAITALQELSDKCLDLNDTLLRKAVSTNSVQKSELNKLVSNVQQAITNSQLAVSTVTKVDVDLVPDITINYDKANKVKA